MLQISNINDTKTEWSMNETRLLIPMIDGGLVANKYSEKCSSNTIISNNLENLDHAILTGGNEQNLVIGLDRNLFETNLKNELLVIHNSDLKLFSCSTELKNSVTYTLSYLEPDKNEILWEGTVSKDKSKVGWCSGAEVNFDEVSKTWQDDLEKSNEPISFEDVESQLTSQVHKIDRDILVSADGDKPYEIDINYYKPENQFELHKSNKNNDIIASISKHDINEVGRIGSKITQDNVQEDEKFLQSNVKHEVKNIVQPQHNRNKNENSLLNKNPSFLPEKSLPLKKKAKMKKTTLSVGDTVKLLKIESQNLIEDEGKDSSASKENKNSHQDSSSDSDEPLSNKIKKRKKASNNTFISKSLVNSLKKYESSSIDNNSDESNCKKPNIKGLRNIFSLENKDFNNIYELVDELKRCRIINNSVWELLLTGLKDMNVDVLEEMKEKIECSSCTSYSPQLKGFALVLYFKQPAAFNYLAKFYKHGWPSLNVIKEWKRKLNQCRRQNFNKKPLTV